MGKKIKKKNNKDKNSSKKQSTGASRQAARRNNHEGPDGSSSDSSSPLNSGNYGMVGIYKYATGQVLQWAKTAYQKLYGNKKKKKTSFASLVSLFATCFQTLAEAQIAMPPSIQSSLRTAIAYRRRVSDIYRFVRAADDETFLRHQWIIVQLEKVEQVFLELDKKTTNGNQGIPDSQNLETSTKNGFEALFLEDDDSEEEGDHDFDHKLDHDDRNRFILKVEPTPDEIEAEERCFAVALVLLEITDAREDLRCLWREWAANEARSMEEAGNRDEKSVGDLLAATACTEYTVQALRKLILQISIDYECFDDFDALLEAFSETGSKENDRPSKKTITSHTFVVNDCVLLRNLSGRADLNGREGMICQPQEGGRFAVKLFPTNEMQRTRQNIAVKPENLVPGDTILHRLKQISNALVSFDFETVPPCASKTFGAPPSLEVQKACIKVLCHIDTFQAVAAERDFGSLLRVAMQYFVPIWTSLAKYLPDVGAADVVLSAYLRDFSEKRNVHFHLVLSILVAVDCALAVAECGDPNVAQNAVNLWERTLQKVFDEKVYREAIGIFDAQPGWRSDAFYSHLELQRQMRVSCPTGALFPWVSGAMLLNGLKMHFVCGSGLPYQFVQQYATLLHLYVALRSEGYLRRIPEIEDTLIRMYTKNVFFRGGVPKKGFSAYTKSWQLAIGASASSLRLLEGKSTSRRLPSTNVKGLEKTGLHVAEVSRLMDILQWKSMPISNRESSFGEIQRIAREESRSVFLAPLMPVCLKLWQLERTLQQPRFISRARNFGYNWIANFGSLLPSMNELTLVTFWGLSLADDRTHEEEKDEGLSTLAMVFRRIFTEEPSSDGSNEVELVFNANTHKVDPSLWGQRAAHRSENLIV